MKIPALDAGRVFLLALAATASLVVWRNASPRAERRSIDPALRIWASATVDSAHDARAAGVSFTRSPAIVRLDTRGFGDVERTVGYHEFLRRCASCHEPPDPSMHRPPDWRVVVRRMTRWMASAGVLPMPPDDSAAIIRFLESTSGQRTR